MEMRNNSQIIGAGDEIRTHDIYLGKVTLYPWATPAILVLCKEFILKLKEKYCEMNV